MTAAKQTKTKTADPAKKPQELLATMVEGMRRMFVQDSITLNPYAMRDRWAMMDSTEVFVLLIAGGKRKGKDRNPKFTVGGVFATASLADEKARDLGIDGEDIVRSWEDDITGDSIYLDTIYTKAMKIPMGKAVIVWARVEGLVLNAARLLAVNRFDPMVDALFDPTNPKGIAEVWVNLDFTLKNGYEVGSYPEPWKVPTLVLRVLAADPKTYPLQAIQGGQATQGGADEFVKVAVTRTA